MMKYKFGRAAAPYFSIRQIVIQIPLVSKANDRQSLERFLRYLADQYEK